MWHEGDDMFFLMFEKDEKGNNREVRVDTFPVASGAMGLSCAMCMLLASQLP